VRRTPERRRADRAAGIDGHGRPLPRALERRFGDEARALRPAEVDPHGLAGVAVLLRRAEAAVREGRIAPADERASAMLRALEGAAGRVEDALNERIVRAIVKAQARKERAGG
jgi:hypothetical protein